MNNEMKCPLCGFHLQGGERPDETFVSTLQHYVRELEQYMKERERTVTPQPADAAPHPSIAIITHRDCTWYDPIEPDNKDKEK